MRTKRILSRLILIAATAAACHQLGADEPASPSDSNPAATRARTLPSGWFKRQGETVGALTTTAVEVDGVAPVVHFDTSGDAASEGPTVADRLRSLRSSAVLNLKPAPSTTDPVPAPPVRETAIPRQRSSRRRPSSTADTPQDTVAPAARAATTERAATEAAATVPAAETETISGQPQPVRQTQPQPLTQPAVPVSPPETSAPTQPMPASDQQPVPVTEPLSETAPPAIQESSEPDEPVMRLGNLDPASSLPSVMKPTTLRADMTTEARATIRPDRDEPTTSDAVDASATDADHPLSVSPAAESVDATIPAEADEPGVLIQHESPLLSVVTRGPETIVVGKTASYAVDVRNRGTVDARQVIVRVSIPQWVEVVQHSPSFGAARVQPDNDGRAVLTWNLDRLSARSREKLILDVIPRGSRPIDLGVTWGFDPEKSTTQIQVQEPKLQLNVIGPQDVLYGETKVYTITVSNPGTGDAENVVLNLMPLVPGERAAGVRNLGVIRAGRRRTVEVELTARQTGRLFVRAEATGDGSLHARGQQEVLVRRASLQATVKGPRAKYAGTRARYVFRISNSGDAAASNVAVVATLPAGSLEVASSDGGSLNPASGEVHWQVGMLRPGSARVFELECTLMSPGANRVDLRTVAEGDLNAVAATVTDVESLADLKLTVNDPKGAVEVGADVAYEVRIQNRGTKAAENIRVFGYFSEGVEPVDVVGWRGQVNEGEVILQTIRRLGAGQEMSVRITAKADRPGDHVFRAELECIAPETKLAVEEWTRFYGDEASTRQAARGSRRPEPQKSPNLQRY